MWNANVLKRFQNKIKPNKTETAREGCFLFADFKKFMLAIVK